MSDRRPRLQEIIDAALARGMRELYTVIPAKVVKWDASDQRADCQILVQQVREDEDGGREAVAWPVVPGVPVVFMGAGGYRITCPISDGNAVVDGERAPATTGCLWFSHRSLDRWLSGTGGEVDPEYDHDHAEADAIFTPGLRPFGSPWGDVPTDHMTIGKDGSDDVQIHFHGTSAVLGAEAQAEFMFLAETLLADLKSAATTLNTILLGGTVGGPTAQQIQQAAQWALTNLFIKLQATPSPYLSTRWKNK